LAFHSITIGVFKIVFGCHGNK